MRQDMQTPQVNLKDPILAAILAYLVPGLGHLYQGRWFKAAIYSVCILSLYVYGLVLSNWKIVQYRGGPGEPRTELLSFAAQAGVGLPGLFAMNQTRRYRRAAEHAVTAIGAPLSAPFVGTIEARNPEAGLPQEISGRLHLQPAIGRFNEPTISGTITAETNDGGEMSLPLGPGVRLGPELRNDPRRTVEGEIIRAEQGSETRVGRVRGSIPRSFWNWFAVPLSDAEEQNLHRELGKLHELALVFTMIAGLLNILAVWDAYDGPAYGYGLQSDAPAESDSSPRSAEATAAVHS